MHTTQKVLVLDIDGTLTNSKKQITQKTLTALLQMQEAGHIVVLASGRPTHGIQNVAKKLRLEEYGGYILSFNGGKIINCKTHETIYQKIMPLTVIPPIYEMACSYHMGMVTYTESTVITGTPIDKHMAFEAKINEMEIKQVDNFIEAITFDVNKLLLTADPDIAARVEVELQQLWGDQLSIYRSEPFFLEIMPQGIDKAASLEVLLKHLGLTKKEAICCGDGFNDMSMIQYAGIGVAMSNAQPVVKEVADYITTSNDEDGLIPVIEKFILQ